MGRWTLTALVINSIIGSGIFGLPSVVAGYLGWWSPLAYARHRSGCGLGGHVLLRGSRVAIRRVWRAIYLYSREACSGRFAGIETGWLSWLSRSTAVAAAVNLFVNYVAQFWPNAERALPRFAISTILIAILAAVNYRGVKAGAAASNIFTVAKLSALFLFALAGRYFPVARAFGFSTGAVARGGFVVSAAKLV